MLSATHESMSGVDLAWLRMERPTNPMMVVGVLTLASRIKLARVRAIVAKRMLRFTRFRQLPVQDVSGAHWEDDPNFALEAHVHPLTLPSRAGQAQLEAATTELASTALDPRHPLWQMHVVERYRRGSAVIVRFHHCYADGMALLRVLASLTDTTPHTPSVVEAEPAHASAFATLPLVGSALSVMQAIGSEATGLVTASLHALTHPSEATALAKQIAGATAELARIAALSEDVTTPLKLGLGTRKHVAWTSPLSLSEVKTIGRALDCTVNDVLLATTAGAFGDYLRRTHDLSETLTMRALVPVNLRGPETQASLGNRFGLVFADLPVGEPNPVARLLSVHRSMQALKESSQPLLSFWLLAGMGLLPGAIETEAIDLFTKKATLVISNVPGPQYPLYLAGARVEEQLFWVPQAGSIGIGVSLLTYNGRVHFGVMADRNLITDPKSVCEAFAREFEKLLLCIVSQAPPLATDG
jgi:diacylglycerol O-acyltransferase